MVSHLFFGIRCKLKITNTVVPVVEITANNTLVSLGDDVIISCSVLRGNPSNYNYAITNINTGSITTTGPTLTLTDIEMTDIGTYCCDVTNIAGTESAHLTIALEGEITDNLSPKYQPATIFSGPMVYLNLNSRNVLLNVARHCSENSNKILCHHNYMIYVYLVYKVPKSLNMLLTFLQNILNLLLM